MSLANEFVERMDAARDAAAYRRHRGLTTGKAAAGHYAKAAVEAGSVLQEFRVTPEQVANYKVGGVIGADVFTTRVLHPQNQHRREQKGICTYKDNGAPGSSRTSHSPYSTGSSPVWKCGALG